MLFTIYLPFSSGRSDDDSEGSEPVDFILPEELKNMKAYELFLIGHDELQEGNTQAAHVRVKLMVERLRNLEFSMIIAGYVFEFPMTTRTRKKVFSLNVVFTHFYLHA